MKTVSSILLMLCICLITTMPSPASDGPSGRILFTIDRDIWVINADGTGQKKLTNLDKCNYPVWSPDGKRIAFHQIGEEAGICILQADGSNPALVPGTEKILGRPCWSPKGDELLFGDSSQKALCSVPAEGGAIRVLSAGNPDAWDPSISPGGSFIIFFAGNYEAGRVTRVNIPENDSSKNAHHALTKNPSAYPSLSRDGKKVTFIQDGAIWIMNADGTKPEQVAKTEGRSYKEPCWSPDGRYLAARSESSDGLEIVIVNLSSRIVKALKLGATDVDAPCWGP
ncbi:MAG: hypothetical protein AB9903_27825 [Vulcanimicrobiota bacterium]